MVGHGGGVGRAVEQHFSGEIDHRDPLFLERFFVLPGKRIDICSSGEGIQELDVEELQLAVELFGLEMFFTSILEDDEAGMRIPAVTATAGGDTVIYSSNPYPYPCRVTMCSL